ncbi:hypothetical protein GQ55_2G250300 [Panicum hallii var. hallii]|uniref:H15 domain-containing protein n=1 Tax=Panicum hallii var. hallii TaxID=1504633 RepID=A0A2T7ES39_9POAL|nr:hypothetical protein GQ55_2G250300 [Panicum hallii var. hallii]
MSVAVCRHIGRKSPPDPSPRPRRLHRPKNPNSPLHGPANPIHGDAPPHHESSAQPPRPAASMADDDGAAPELAPPPPPPPPPLPSYPEVEFSSPISFPPPICSRAALGLAHRLGRLCVRSLEQMILEAIDALDNDNGSNKTAISGYLKGNLPTDHTSLLTINLGRMKSSGGIIFARNYYFRPYGDDEEVEKEEPSAPAPADPASPLRPNGHEDPAVAEDSTGVFDADSFFHDDGDDGLLASPLGVAADEIAVPAPAPGVAADEIAVPAPAPGVAADEIAVPDPAPGIAADEIDAPAPAPAVTADAAAGPVKRGRGRPPKPKYAVAEDSSDSPAETSLVAADAVAEPPKRGRGRPPKPKDPVAEASVVAIDAAAVPAKRGRGRPPTPKDPAAMGTSGEPTAAANAPVKRGRGRPPKPKDLIAEATARATSGMIGPRPLGRPPKKAKVEEASISAPAAAPGTAGPVKRGRGCPPKVRH